MLNGKQYLTVEDIARFFEVGEPTVRQWVSRKQLKPQPDKVNIGRGRSILIFAEDEVRDFANRKYGAA